MNETNKNQIPFVLPRTSWEKITIIENNEPFVEIKETDRVKINLIKKDYHVSFFVRQSIAEKLEKISQNLPAGINLVIIEGYRSTESQKSEWCKAVTAIKSKNPSLSDEEITKMVGMLIARPLPLANHHCGGAIDVTLANVDNTLLDMGTPYISEITDPDDQKYIPMLAEGLTEQQYNNRLLLRTVMEKEGFVWYPGEWWHYCYGDRMWAVYTNQNECFYGSIEM